MLTDRIAVKIRNFRYSSCPILQLFLTCRIYSIKCERSFNLITLLYQGDIQMKNEIIKEEEIKVEVKGWSTCGSYNL